MAADENNKIESEDIKNPFCNIRSGGIKIFKENYRRTSRKSKYNENLHILGSGLCLQAENRLAQPDTQILRSEHTKIKVTSVHFLWENRLRNKPVTKLAKLSPTSHVTYVVY